MAEMVLPPPAPQSELEGLQAGYKNAAQEVAPAPLQTPHGANGAPPMIRKEGSSARHPMSKKFTNK